MTFDADLAEHLLADFEAHPERHGQGTWGRRTPCGTAYCMAGGVAALAEARGEVQLRWVRVTEGEYELSGLLFRGEWCATSAFAAEQLGLGRLEAGLLFDAGNTLGDLRAMVAQLKEHGTLYGHPVAERVHRRQYGTPFAGDPDDYYA